MDGYDFDKIQATVNYSTLRESERLPINQIETNGHFNYKVGVAETRNARCISEVKKDLMEKFENPSNVKYATIKIYLNDRGTGWQQ